jgi:hypothetical protein
MILFQGVRVVPPAKRVAPVRYRQLRNGNFLEDAL